MSMARIWVGTSGYGYHEWVGPVYPEGTPAEDYLSLYEGLFPTVELNFSYYRMPTADQLTHMLLDSQKLIFSIKANDTLTHRIDPLSWKDRAAEFRRALGPLADSGRLGAVLFQFPFSFHYDIDRRRYLDSLCRSMASLPLVVEFRNPQWYNNRLIEGLRSRGITLAGLDLPTLQDLPPVMDVITSPLAYLRFHGRNGETWWGSDSASRYDYLYSEVELESFVQRIRALSGRSERIFVYFNNHRRGQAVKNGLRLVEMLKNEELVP